MTYYRAYRSFENLRKQEYLGTYLYKIAVNYTRDLQREFKLTRGHDVGIDEIPDSKLDLSGIFVESAESTYATREELEILSRSLDLLTPKHRNVIVLHAFKGLTYKEIASLEGVSIGVVMSRLHYARKYLKQMLNSVLPKDTPKNGHAQESKHIPNLEHHLQYEPLTSHSQSLGGTVHGNGMPNESPLTGKGKVYYLPRPSRQQRYQRKAHSTAKTLEQSVEELERQLRSFAVFSSYHAKQA